VTLPELLGSMNYTINIRSNVLEIESGGEMFYRNIITRNVTGTLEKGNNVLRNVDSVVVIS
jgi:hypothetical protein